MPRAKPATPDAEARQSILEAIRAADAPVTATNLGKLPGIGTGARVKLLLQEEVAEGRIFEWGKSTYWHLHPEELARKRLVDLAGRECLSKSVLAKRAAEVVPKISSKTVQLMVKKLIAEERFLAKENKTPNIPGIIDVSHPELYLELKIDAILKSIGIERSPARIRLLLAPEIDVPTPPADVREVADQMFAVMNRLAFAPGTTVTFYLLRQQPELAHIPKAIFDGAALLLQQDRRALLSAHGYAGSIPADERDQLVTDGFGNYYVSIYAR
jgi:hypothetical protein